MKHGSKRCILYWQIAFSTLSRIRRNKLYVPDSTPAIIKLRHLLSSCYSPVTIAVGVLVLTILAATAAGDPLRVRFVTFNVDFNNTTQEVRDDVTAVAPRADVIMFQEAKEVTIDNFLDDTWNVIQVVDQGDARRGSAIAIRKSIANQLLASGLRFGVDSNGENMLDRYIIWLDVELTNGRRLRLMSLHMPPQRIAYLQRPMADNLAAFVAVTPYPAVVGADWNFIVNNDPLDITEATGLIPQGVGIDGFYFDPAVTSVVSVNELTGLNVNSDHDPVQMITNIADEPSSIVDWNLYN